MVLPMQSGAPSKGALKVLPKIAVAEPSKGALKVLPQIAIGNFSQAGRRNRRRALEVLPNANEFRKPLSFAIACR